MTENKQIMIDGVDVSKCECCSQIDLDSNIICISNFPSKKSGYCKDNTNCLFKQHARKTQECEELKTDIKDIANLLDLDTGEKYNFGNIEIAIKGLKQECEELKKQYNCYACDTCKGKEDYINLKRHCENAIKSLHNKHAELDLLKAENELLKDKLTSLACFYETSKEYDKSCIETAKSNKCLLYDDDICRLDDIRNNSNRDCLRCIKESYLRLYSLNWDNQYRLIEENIKSETQKEQAEQKLKRIREICKSYCKLMCLSETKETCESCINTEVLEIIDEVE